MKVAINIICAACLALFSVGCADAMNEPITPDEARSAQQLDLQNAEYEPVRPELAAPCEECYEVILMRTQQAQSDDGEDSGERHRFDKRQLDRPANAFDGDPVPWPLDEKRED